MIQLVRTLTTIDELVEHTREIALEAIASFRSLKSIPEFGISASERLCSAYYILQGEYIDPPQPLIVGIEKQDDLVEKEVLEINIKTHVDKLYKQLESGTNLEKISEFLEIGELNIYKIKAAVDNSPHEKFRAEIERYCTELLQNLRIPHRTILESIEELNKYNIKDDSGLAETFGAIVHKKSKEGFDYLNTEEFFQHYKNYFALQDIASALGLNYKSLCRQHSILFPAD